MQRLYYLTDTLDSTVQISRDFHLAGLDQRHVQVVAADAGAAAGRRLPLANEFEKRDLIRNWEIGATIGFLFASAVTAYVVTVDPFGIDLGFFVHALIFVLITLFGGWVGGMVGIESENHQLRPFHNAIAEGQFLILVDVAQAKADSIKARMARLHPEARLVREGVGGLLAIL